MSLSKVTASILIDLVENKLTMLQIDDREDLREVVTLQRCLGELKTAMGCGDAQEAAAIPHRGRHRKLTALMEDMNIASLAQRQSA